MASPRTKHSRIFASLSEAIRSGRFSPGDRMPSEAELVREFGVSRITVNRAMRDLAQAGLVQRRRGSGTYVAERALSDGQSFGLLIPNLGESEIFEPICHGMMASPLAGRRALLWGTTAVPGRKGRDAVPKADCAWQLCRQFVDRRVDGVFFAPLEHVPEQDRANERIIEALDRARIPVVLLDRPLRPFPALPTHDLVGIDNRAAGYFVTDHLLRLGCRRVHFVGQAGAASTVDDRAAGFRDALHANGRRVSAGLSHDLESHDDDDIRRIMDDARPDGIVCANDRVAAQWMHGLLRLGYAIPGDVRLVSIDDMDYAALLPVPLTTLRQPARRLGDVALVTMLERLARPDLPPRDIRLHCELIVRKSCGAAS